MQALGAIGSASLAFAAAIVFAVVHAWHVLFVRTFTITDPWNWHEESASVIWTPHDGIHDRRPRRNTHVEPVHGVVVATVMASAAATLGRQGVQRWDADSVREGAEESILAVQPRRPEERYGRRAAFNLDAAHALDVPAGLPFVGIAILVVSAAGVVVSR